MRRRPKPGEYFSMGSLVGNAANDCGGANLHCECMERNGGENTGSTVRTEGGLVLCSCGGGERHHLSVLYRRSSCCSPPPPALQVCVISAVLLLLLRVVGVSDASADVRIECLADRYRAAGNQWRGYTLHDLGLPSLGALDFTLAFPKDIPLTSCCQRIQLRFTATTIRNIVTTTADNEGGYFVPNVEWTLCTTDTRLFNCYGYNDMTEDSLDSPSPSPDEVTSGSVSSQKPLSGSWWVILQHCLKPGSKTASYEVGTFGLSGMSAVSAPRYSGDIQVGPLSGVQVPRVQVSSVLPCLIEGHVDTHAQWYGYLATMTVPRDSSISYRFLFKEAEPSNDALLTVLFYSETDIVGMSDSDTCEQKVSILSKQPNTHKILPLSIGNTWSGCAVESVNGTPTYTCEGGRHVDEAHTVYIALANCERTLGLQLYYFFEFQNYESECPSTASSSSSEPPSGSGCAGLVCRTIVLLLCLVCRSHFALYG